jgi:hypothetical protein
MIRSKDAAVTKNEVDHAGVVDQYVSVNKIRDDR